jgi:hypothetical protein
VRERPVNEEKGIKIGKKGEKRCEECFLGFTPADTRAEKGTAKCTMGFH